MPIWLLNRRSALFEENTENEWNGWNDKATDNQNTSADWGEKKEGNNTIPYERFKEVNDRMKSAEAKLQEIENEKKAKAQEEAIKKGEYEKIISQKDQEIANFKKQQETWNAREEAITKRNDERKQSLEKSFGEDWNSVKNLIDDIQDPFILSTKLDSLEKMKSAKTTQWQQGWSWVPWSWWQTRKEYLKEKLEKEGRLTAKEKSELMSLSN